MHFGCSKKINWILFLERKDVTLGYTKNNVCFICFEFNTCCHDINNTKDMTGSCGWSKDKFQLFYSKVLKEIIL